MMELITGMAKRNNQTLIIVTHDLEIAHYANTIISIRDGNVEKVIHSEDYSEEDLIKQFVNI